MNKVSTYQKHQGVEESAFGKLILIGEHAVVYGYPAIALPFKRLHTTARITPHPGPIDLDCRFYKGPLHAAPACLQGLVRCIRENLLGIGEPEEGFRISLHSTIPPGRGLGSSAAVAAAAVRGITSFFDQTLSHERLLALIHIAETYAHGTPSGIDAATVVADKPIWFKKGNAVTTLSPGRSFHMVVADSGQMGDTASAVGSVRQHMTAEPVDGWARLNHLGALTWEVRNALIKGDIQGVGGMIQQAQGELETFGVSHAHLDQLIVTANRAGALGAKLTGGGQGGCILALARNAEHANKLQKTLLNAGASHVWGFTIGERSRT